MGECLGRMPQLSSVSLVLPSCIHMRWTREGADAWTIDEWVANLCSGLERLSRLSLDLSDELKRVDDNCVDGDELLRPLADRLGRMQLSALTLGLRSLKVTFWSPSVCDSSSTSFAQVGAP